MSLEYCLKSHVNDSLETLVSEYKREIFALKMYFLDFG